MLHTHVQLFMQISIHYIPDQVLALRLIHHTNQQINNRYWLKIGCLHYTLADIIGSSTVVMIMCFHIVMILTLTGYLYHLSHPAITITINDSVCFLIVPMCLEHSLTTPCKEWFANPEAT